MPANIVLGAQWGDEGKAKVVDYLTPAADVVVRYQGGANAGHTVIAANSKFVFHTIPSGIIHEDKICVVGNGVVVDPATMLNELAALEAQGLAVAGRFFVSQVAHVVLPYHKVLEKAGEESKNGVAIGTTLRGIGPAYRDKVERSHGVRVLDLCDPARLRDKLRASICAKNEILTKVFGQEPLAADPIIDAYIGYGEQIAPHVADTSVLLNHALDQGQTVLCEGAQGTLLDIDHGTYPYVTSSNTTAGGACTGAGIGPTRIAEVLGVAKAYTTRVGNGPFPTELLGEEGERLRGLGREFGATTGRPRRCGWFDAAILRVSARINGLTSIALTRLDVLDPCDRLKLGVGYRCGDQVLEEFPADPQVLDRCEPIYEEMPGWRTPTTAARCFDDLPSPAQAYVKRVAELSRVPVSLISVGPEREATIDM